MFRKMMAVLALTALFSTAACTSDGITDLDKPEQTEEDGGFRGVDPPRADPEIN